MHEAIDAAGRCFAAPACVRVKPVPDQRLIESLPARCENCGATLTEGEGRPRSGASPVRQCLRLRGGAGRASEELEPEV